MQGWWVTSGTIHRFGVFVNKRGYFFINSFPSSQCTTNTLIDAKYPQRQEHAGNWGGMGCINWTLKRMRGKNVLFNKASLKEPIKEQSPFNCFSPCVCLCFVCVCVRVPVHTHTCVSVYLLLCFPSLFLLLQ